jgi:hypothetical protein
MFITKKQITANRQNAQKSTGPKSPEGKAIVAKNALKYGFDTKDVIINSPVLRENPAEYEALLESLYEELNPTTAFQEHLVRKIANSLWRSRRIPLAETAQVNDQLEHVESDLQNITGRYKLEIYESNPGFESDAPQRVKTNTIARKLIPCDDVNTNFLRYEFRLDRQLTRSIELLKFLKFYDFNDNEPESPKDTKKMEETNPIPGNLIDDN